MKNKKYLKIFIASLSISTLLLVRCSGLSNNNPSDSAPPANPTVLSVYGINKYFFKSLIGMTLDGAGHFFVADASKGQILKYNYAGDELLKIETGSTSLYYPTDVKLDASGNIYVADSGNSLIQKFNSQGQFLFSFGGTGSGDGQFSSSNFSTSLTIDLSGNIYVVDSGNNRIQKFNSSGTLLAKVSPTIASNLQFIDIDNLGNLWVTDNLNHRVLKFNSNLIFQTQIGVNGSANGELNGPSGIDVDSSGNLYIFDRGNDRVQKFSPSGIFISKIGVDDQYGTPYGLSVDSSENVFVSTTSGSVVKFLANGNTDKIYAGFGNGNSEFNNPEGVITDAAGNIYVVDSGNDRIQKFTPEGVHLFSFGTKGSGPGQFDNPIGIAIDPLNGNIYVTDRSYDRVQKFSSSGIYLSEFGSGGNLNGEFDRPIDLKCDSLGNLFVLDYNNHRIQKFDSQGNFLLTFGSNGSSNSQFDYPRGIALDSSDNIYVADSNNNRVQKFNSSGGHLMTFNTSELVNSAGIVVDLESRIIIKGSNGKLSMFSSNGSLISSFSLDINDYGEDPTGLATSPLGHLIVANRSNHILIKLTKW